MKKFLIIQLRPEDETSDNEFESFLKYGGLSPEEVERLRIEKTGLPEIDLDYYSAIIVGGSPFDISLIDEEKSEIQIKIESDFKRLFEKVVSSDFPFLGACSGSGLLGNYCGAKVSQKYGEPVGGTDMMLTEEGKQDPILEGLPNKFRVLVGHKEACDETPPGAVLLGSSTECPVQMFRVGKNVYATQFHPEGDPEGFTIRINVYKDHGYFPPETAQDLIDAVQKENTHYVQSILRRFVERYHS
jgi:GMP synthase (glutamine-hydrolysing)